MPGMSHARTGTVRTVLMILLPNSTRQTMNAIEYLTDIIEYTGVTSNAILDIGSPNPYTIDCRMISASGHLLKCTLFFVCM